MSFAFSPDCWLSNNACQALRFRAWSRFKEALKYPEEIQKRKLLGLVAVNATTTFGREHGFSSIRTVEQYQERIPLRRYEDFEPYLERIALGESLVLTSSPVPTFLPSGGSSLGNKFIPSTPDLRNEFQAGIAPWLYEMMNQRPGLKGGSAYWSISPAGASQPVLKGVVPVGFEDDSHYLGTWERRFIARTLAVPSEVSRVGDLDRFRYRTLLKLLGRKDLRLISVWNPSFLTLLLEPLTGWWDRVLSDLRRGTEGSRPDPIRATELSKVGPRDFKNFWPELRLISCWTDGPAAGFVPALRELFPEVEIESKGLLATEAIVSIPFGSLRPLALLSHFFEFMDRRGNVSLAQDLKEGGDYSVVVSTGGGFYRYLLQDRVRVEGFVGKTPAISFLGKEDRFSDLCGEKLEEGFVAAAMGRVFKALNLNPAFSLLAPERTGLKRRYLIFLEMEALGTAEVAGKVEEELRAQFHYDYCRRLGQLAPVEFRLLAPGASTLYLQARYRKGQRLGDIKPTALEINQELIETLMALAVKRGAA